ncbi:MAG: DISARM system phospholipase D-like protein DrmC [Candidatus Dormibacteria bacterium]
MSVDPADIARRWAEELPRDFARHLVTALRSGHDALLAVESEAVLPASASAVRVALDLTARGDGPFVGGVLSGWLDAMAEQPTLTPVWTGPESETAHGRLTLAVLSDLIDEAQSDILLVSYATLPSRSVRSALEAAASRDVEISLLLERPSDNPRFEGSDAPFPGLTARRLSWPAENRPTGASMHAKVLVVDRRTALIGSANVTGYGLDRNLECGVLIRGGTVPQLLINHLLSAQGIEAVG